MTDEPVMILQPAWLPRQSVVQWSIVSVIVMLVVGLIVNRPIVDAVAAGYGRMVAGALAITYVGMVASGFLWSWSNVRRYEYRFFRDRLEYGARGNASTQKVVSYANILDVSFMTKGSMQKRYGLGTLIIKVRDQAVGVYVLNIPDPAKARDDIETLVMDGAPPGAGVGTT